MVVMHDTDTRNDTRLHLRIPEGQLDRVDLMAAYTGRNRSDYMRAALDIADAELVLDAIRQLEERGPLTSDQKEKKQIALTNLTALIIATRPKVLEI